jgi:hypothetical protein
MYLDLPDELHEERATTENHVPNFINTVREGWASNVDKARRSISDSKMYNLKNLKVELSDDQKVLLFYII